MATKKECDRCGKQWTPSTDRDPYTENIDTELSTVQINVPRDNSRYSTPEIKKTVELCQACGRFIAKQLERQPDITTPEGQREAERRG
jgi:ribosomal protein S27AE